VAQHVGSGVSDLQKIVRISGRTSDAGAMTAQREGWVIDPWSIRNARSSLVAFDRSLFGTAHVGVFH
jgi:hypothetical protein